MASQAYLDAVNGKQGGVTRQSLLDDIYRATQDYSNSLVGASNAGSTHNWDQANAFRSQAIRAQETQNQLKYLLNAGTNSGAWNEDGSSGGGGGSANPFSAGGSGAPTLSQSNAFGAAPTLSTANRFEPGLTDAETRLRSLLDNPDSIQQSAAYKFRVAQGQEALQRSLGARGLLNSGNRLMELTKYGQDMGAQEYDAQYGRLGNLLNTQQQGWLGDKNANTNQFSAQSNAWLGDKNANTNQFSAQSNAWNTAQANQDRVNIADKEIWAKRTPIPIPGVNGGFWKA